MILEQVRENLESLLNRFDEIPNERKQLLASFSDYISAKVKENLQINLTFICTHNSRRSIMSQIWAQAAAEYYGIENVNCYSGGTEATAFNPRALKAVVNYGFNVDAQNDSQNPIYLVRFSKNVKPIKCFSKVYSDPSNPQENFAAIMTCSDADENCPVVFGAEARFPIKYDDPKEFDGTEIEEIKYKERFEQIGIELLFAFNLIK